MKTDLTPVIAELITIRATLDALASAILNDKQKEVFIKSLDANSLRYCQEFLLAYGDLLNKDDSDFLKSLFG